MAKKIRVGVLFGGRSCEHEVSVTSARSVLAAIDRDQYDITMIGIDKTGHWLKAGDALKVLATNTVGGDDLRPVVLNHTDGGLMASDGTPMSDGQLDVVLPLLHGPYGEDGTVQGLLELAGTAYVGCGVLGSAVGMDKEMMKRVFRAEGLPQLDYSAVRRRRWHQDRAAVQAQVEAQLDYPLFFKPANLGSSVGVCKAHGPEEFAACMDEAAAYDQKIIIEATAIDCREIECAILGNDNPQASVLGEVIPSNEFYDYSAKYVDDNSQLIIPAQLPPETTASVQALAIKAFQAIDAAGLSRVDFFVGKTDNQVYLNEINTLPGFTPISMYPKLWAASGLEYGALIDRLIQLALERHSERQDIRSVL
jgi:D-alanine-D-alanine ligase